MPFMNKWLGGLAAAALVAFAAPAARADDTQAEDTPQVVVPGDSAPADVVTPEDDTVEEAAVPGQDNTNNIIVTQPRRGGSLDNVIVEIGGGASTFTGQLGDELKGGAGWTGRAVIGARSMLGFELGYFGTANTVEGTGTDITDVGDLSNDNTVVSNAGEALVRLNLLGERAAVKPFVAGGANYTRFDSNTNLDNIDSVGIPLAAGIQFYPMDNFTIGARGDYRILTDWLDDTLPSGNQWGGMLTVGANF